MADIETVKVVTCEDGVSFDYDEMGTTLEELAQESDDALPPVFIRYAGLLLSATKATLYKSTDDDGDVTWEIVIDAS